MIEIYLKYDNMHIFRIINTLNCINNHVNSCISSMLSITSLQTYILNIHIRRIFEKYIELSRKNNTI